MNRNLKKLIPLVFILCAIFADSCKKGKEDPFISFRTRKNRVVGEWSLKSGRYSYKAKSANGAPEGHSFDFTDSQFTYVLDIPGTIYTGKAIGPYSRYIKFEKNGYVKIMESIDNSMTIIEGTWDFNTGVGEDKSKELIIINVKSYTGSSGKKTYGGNQKSMTFSITELRHKKMVLYMKDSVTQPDGSSEEMLETIELSRNR